MKLHALILLIITFEASAFSLGGRIINGNPANAGEFPWQAAINVNQQNGKYFCGGAILNGDYILTAAHCTVNSVLFTIYLGSTHLQSSDENRLIVATSTAFTNPNFDQQTLEADIALIKVHMTIKFSDYILTIALNSAPIEPSTKVIASGWGQIDDATAGTVNQLNFVELVTLSNTECKNYYGDAVLDNMVCAAGNSNEGICIGDTGGPLIVDLDKNPSVVGVASFMSSRGCESYDPSGFTRVEPYLDWINGYLDA